MHRTLCDRPDCRPFRIGEKMENRVICNIILDSCGLLILLMLLLPLLGGRDGRKLNGR